MMSSAEAAPRVAGGQEHSAPIEIDGGSEVEALAFSSNGDYLVSGGRGGVRVWRVEDGRQMAAMATAGTVWCLTVSKDGKWIAGGTIWGEVVLWNARTYKKAFSHKEEYYDIILGVDFSPDSARLVIASRNGTATVLDIATRELVLGLLRHHDFVIAARYSPKGDRIATATRSTVRIYDSRSARLLVELKAKVTSLCNNGLFWSNNKLFIVSDGKIKQVNASTAELAVSEWSVPNADASSCIAPLQHGAFVAYAADRTVTFWDASTHTHFGLIQHNQDIRSIARSPGDRFLAIGGQQGKITINSLPRITVPFIDISDTALDSWRQGQLADAEALLTKMITNAKNPSHHTLANRALVRAHMEIADPAIKDAEESIRIRPSVIGYIARSVTLVTGGRVKEGCRIHDFVFRHCDPTHVDLLLLIKAVILFMAGEHDDAILRVSDLIDTVRLNSIYCVVQSYMYLFLGNSYMESSDYDGAVASFRLAETQIRSNAGPYLLSISLISGWKFDGLDIVIRQRLCEALYAAGRAKEAGESLLIMVNAFDKEIYMSGSITEWVSGFTQKCLSTPESDHELLREWAKSTLMSGEWEDALCTAGSFTAPRFSIYRVICERLEATDSMLDASQCFHQMVVELMDQTGSQQAEWISDFKCRCEGALERIGDTSLSAERHDDAISHYSAVLSIHPAASTGIFIKRSKAYLAKGSWRDALDDANKVIELDPSSPWGHERKHAALHKAGNYDEAIQAFETMLSMMSESPDLDIRERHRHYVHPQDTHVAIRKAVQGVIRDMPRVLIDTTSGHLLNKSQLASAFESLPVFEELVCSMTTHIDQARINHDVAQYYRYAMFSHKWENNEPLYERVVGVAVYDLEESPTHNKLREFCGLVRDAKLHWAWSDTCCINRADNLALQEALVSMFRWYQGSAVTIVLLRGVRFPSLRGDLVRSIWNTRAWTFQEYHASKVVRFYTEDWRPYMNPDIPNHKESPLIISEMEEATGVSAQALMALRPGLDYIREKLCLASRRQTTLVEDAAYSLLGIFSTPMNIIYGEGDQALGRLLVKLLVTSGDTSILAWTGRSGTFNSCLPASITVFNRLPAAHIPLVTASVQMDVTTIGLRFSSYNLALAMRLYDRLDELPVPSFAEQRMRLPCIVFKLGSLSASRGNSEHVFRANTAALGVVEIKTKEDLSRFDSLYLIHPWIDYLLDRRQIGSPTELLTEEDTDDHSTLIGGPSPSPSTPDATPATPQTRAGRRLVPRLGRLLFNRRSSRSPSNDAPLLPPSSVSQTDKQMQVLRFMARLRQPFGALLFTPRRHHAHEYKRIAAESMITVQIQEDAPLKELAQSARVLDVL